MVSRAVVITATTTMTRESARRDTCLHSEIIPARLRWKWDVKMGQQEQQKKHARWNGFEREDAAPSR